ncbi:MAG: HPF/RaiA family ribosome-associated protein [Bryobacteraceae bacterium]|nr:HPF/RaiA family ribosome-associated protein [Bryobacteraceae bacterium]
MKIQINSDKNISTSEAQAASFRNDVERLLARYGDFLTRVEVYLSDDTGPKKGLLDKRCNLEVRPKGKAPVSVSHTARKIESAVRGASQKMQRLLETIYGKRAVAEKRQSATKRSAPNSRSSVAKAHRVETLLEELMIEAPQAGTHVNSAYRAVQRAIEAIDDAPAPTKAAGRRKPAAKGSAKSKKPMPIHQARRRPAKRLG